ncbi:HBR291Cp [Eremothecium sinecaudum]|uniref:HBR291Cp n=1 Tax=Eremothecium sinecaudum TaxID=45286 RepID=A0A109UXZ0_9SACH|nr:HBR291Cp [Eremothecium sinecaudum]AMD19192.1 HBR291Cp [Eremothecium sinecaudum]
MSDLDPSHSPDQLRAIAAGTTRFVLSQCESQHRSTIISKTRFTNAVRDMAATENVTNIKNAVVFDHVNSLLQDIYGFKLIGIRSKKSNAAKHTNVEADHTTSAQPADQPTDLGFKGDRFILINTIPFPPELSKYTINWSRDTFFSLPKESSTTIAQEPTLQSTLSTSQQLTLQGIIAVTLCIVVLMKNNCLQQELLIALAKFGIPIDGTLIPVVNMRIQDVLSHMTRLEYLQRRLNVASSTIADTPTFVSDDIIFYSLDSRAQTEFPPEALARLCQQLLALDDTAMPALQESIRLSVGDAYVV